MTTPAAVLDALAGVRDPELDEPLTELGFVSEVRIEGSRVRVRLRLPTYFCAPNFAYLMVADAHAAVRALPGVEHATIALDDHFASAQINAAARTGGAFADAFPGETAGDVAPLRDLFTRKAFVARQARVCDALLRTGRTVEELAAMRLGQLEGPDAERCAELRRELRLDASPDAPAFVLPDGGTPDAIGLARYLRVARVVRLSLEGNAGLCRALLKTRYGLRDPEELAA